MQVEREQPASIVDVARQLAAHGYFPVPIERGNKGPTIAGWDRLRLTEDTVDHYFRAGEGMLVGVLHVNLLAFDVDVYDADLAAEITQECKRRFPGALLRIGEAPKTALFLRLDEPFRIRATHKYRKGDISAQVDVRSDTRQIVAYGIHPTTGRRYTWPEGDLYKTPRADLPGVTEEAAAAFRDWCEARLREWAGETTDKIVALSQPSRQHDEETAPEEEFRDALAHIPCDLGYDQWLQALMGIHDYYTGSAHGLDVAKAWSAPYSHYDPREVEAKWRSFEVGRGVSYRTVFAMAREHGADLGAMARKRNERDSAESPFGRPLHEDFEIRRAEVQAERKAPEPADLPPFDTTPLDRASIRNIPPRRWLYGRKLIRGFCSAVVSPGGGAKSTWTTAVACDLASGEKTLHDDPHAPLRCMIYNLEDPRDEGLRKVAAVDFHKGLTDEALGNIMVLSGRDRSLIVAEEKERGVFVATPDVDLLIETLKRERVDVLIVDPAIRAHRLPENDNKAIDLMMDQFARIAHEADVAILLVHHTRKGAGGGDMDAARGASSMVSAARVVLTLSVMSPEEAVDMNVPEEKRRFHVRVDNAKSNLAPPPTAAEWFRLESVSINNETEEYPEGDSIGVACYWSPPSPFADIGEHMEAIFARIRRGYVHENGMSEPYSMTRQHTGERYAAFAVLASFPDGSKSEKQAMACIRSWIENGLLVEKQYKNANNDTRKGLFVGSDE